MKKYCLLTFLALTLTLVAGPIPVLPSRPVAGHREGGLNKQFTWDYLYEIGFDETAPASPSSKSIS